MNADECSGDCGFLQDYRFYRTYGSYRTYGTYGSCETQKCDCVARRGGQAGGVFSGVHGRESRLSFQRRAGGCSVDFVEWGRCGLRGGLFDGCLCGGGGRL